jgi:hypothetical protein
MILHHDHLETVRENFPLNDFFQLGALRCCRGSSYQSCRRENC